MKKIIYIFLLIFLIGCSNKKIQPKPMEEQVIIHKNIVEKENSIESENRKYDRINLRQHDLNNMGLPNPVSLREISDWLTDENRNNITSISIYNGENIYMLDGIDLFPALESLDIYNSKIRNINDIQKKYFKIRSLFIESNALEDISNIIFFENLVTLYFTGSEKIKSFPDITHLKKLRSLSLSNFKGINFSNLAEKLPLGIQIIGLSDCDIKSLNDIANLFQINIKLFDLQSNLIKEIDFDMDYGAATYIYMTGCPVGDKYIKWDEPDVEEYPRRVRNTKGVLFDFGYFQDEVWIIEE